MRDAFGRYLLKSIRMIYISAAAIELKQKFGPFISKSLDRSAVHGKWEMGHSPNLGLCMAHTNAPDHCLAKN